MERERRKFQRFSGELPACLCLRLGSNGPPLCRPISCHVTDLSRSGAGLITLQIISDGHHLFYEAMESDHHILHLDLECSKTPGQPSERIALPVRPVWLDRLLIEGQQPFLLGVEFTEKISNDLLQRLKELISK